MSLGPFEQHYLALDVHIWAWFCSLVCCIHSTRHRPCCRNVASAPLTLNGHRHFVLNMWLDQDQVACRCTFDLFANSPITNCLVYIVVLSAFIADWPSTHVWSVCVCTKCNCHTCYMCLLRCLCVYLGVRVRLYQTDSWCLSYMRFAFKPQWPSTYDVVDVWSDCSIYVCVGVGGGLIGCQG